MHYSSMNATSTLERGDDRRRADWQRNDRRQTWPWVTDTNDRRNGEDRRLQERRMRQGVAARTLELSRRNNQRIV